MSKEVAYRLPTDTPGVFLVTRENNNVIEHLRETTSTTGEVPDPNNVSQTIERITITRETLSTIG